MPASFNADAPDQTFGNVNCIPGKSFFRLRKKASGLFWKTRAPTAMMPARTERVRGFTTVASALPVHADLPLRKCFAAVARIVFSGVKVELRAVIPRSVCDDFIPAPLRKTTENGTGTRCSSEAPGTTGVHRFEPIFPG
jgi:hypothetical protein